MDRDGYGRVFYKKHKIRLAHRLSYFLYYGDFDKQLKVLHKCDNPSCVNPEHLFLGTTEDNIRDRVVKERSAVGERQHSSKLTKDIVIKIRNEYASGAREYHLAKKYGVRHVSINKIINRISWKHI